VAKILRDGSAATNQQPPHDTDSQRNNAPHADPPKTAHGTILGTPGYMAPEQARGEVDGLDERADIYSLGALLQFLTGSGEPVRTREGSGSAPKAVAAIAATAMSKEPSSRYAAVSDMAQDVSRYLDGLSVSAYPENIVERAARVAYRYRVAIGLVIAYLVVRTLLFLWFRR